MKMSEDRSCVQFTEKDYTVVFCRRENVQGQREVLLGLKKRGFAVGKWDGFGGKIEAGETVEQAAMRELEEESCIKATSLNRVGYIVFKYLETAKIMRVNVFDTWHFEGTPSETEEMRPQWFLEEEVPYDMMWKDHHYWMRLIFEDKSFIGRFVYEDDETIVESNVQVQGSAHHSAPL